MNLQNFWNNESLAKHKSEVKKIFFYRISGMGMGTTATLFKDQGYQVAGCDMQFYPPMGDYLKKRAIPCFTMEQTNEELLKQYDLIVVGNSVGKGSKDATLIENCGVPFTSFPALLGEYILKEREVVGIAGTHGKTTTTYYMIQVLSGLGLDVGYLVGGVLDDREASKLGSHKYFIIEADEYDSSYFQKFSKLRLYQIKHLVLSALEYDHADIFPTLKDITNQFLPVAAGLKSFLGNHDYPEAKVVADEFQKFSKSKPAYYGLEYEGGPYEIEQSEKGSTFKLRIDGKEESFQTNIVGKQNILNLTACILFCVQEKLPLLKVKEILKNMKNVKRRQEFKGHYGELIVIDDFAHHPTAIKLTLDSVKKLYPNKPVHIIFEAITSTARSDAFQKEFAECFTGADSVLVANPQVPTNATQLKNLDYAKLSQDLNSFGHFSREYKKLEDLRSKIDEWKKTPGILLVLSNRTVLGLWESSFVQELKK
ncbi:MAG: Mur ligase family protein [Bacteriovoracaceae bacterium]|nr:Mur ligase family protein [Bacteriovoracaceae bacterium]